MLSIGTIHLLILGALNIWISFHILMCVASELTLCVCIYIYIVYIKLYKWVIYIGTMLGHRWVQLLPWHPKNWEAWPLSEGDGGGLRSSQGLSAVNPTETYMAHNLDPCLSVSLCIRISSSCRSYSVGAREFNVYYIIFMYWYCLVIWWFPKSWQTTVDGRIIQTLVIQ